MSRQPDICLFLSDQHAPQLIQGAPGTRVDTPQLQALAEAGTAFDAAYTAFPLCVPARMALLTGQLSSRTGIMNNPDVLPGGMATLAHSLAAAGYDTVLCGRMHFTGPDQWHGFTERLVGDFTPQFPGRGGEKRADLGPYAGTPAQQFDKLYGGGDSPVLAYDRAVVAAALDVLAKRTGDKPLFLVVGTYGPHHTFVAPPGLYQKYKDRLAGVPETSDACLHPSEAGLRRSLDPETRRGLSAAYHGMVEQLDRQVGEVRAAWDAFGSERDRPQRFVYASDHGEQLGQAGFWGKRTFRERSIRVPLLVAGDGIPGGRRLSEPVSLLDLAPTFIEWAGGRALPAPDGVSLAPVLSGGSADRKRCVVADNLIGDQPGRMVRYQHFKYVHYADAPEADLLFDLAADPDEAVNRAAELPAIAEYCRGMACRDWDPAAIRTQQARQAPHLSLLAAWGAAVAVPEPWRWPVPESARQLPKP